jgi:phosphoribosylamine--glycine ligase
MNVLVVGGGGREHAICDAISKSPMLKKLYCTPGNAGIAAVAQCWPLNVDQIPQIIQACLALAVDFVVIGPEGPLALGIADEICAAGIPCFGPSKLATELESSKGFMKDLCTSAGVPTAKYQRFTDAEAARTYIRKQHDESGGAPIVVKADGLAAGKGVTIAQTIDEAIAAVDAAMEGKIFGKAGTELVIEEYMEGEEVSFFALCDGEVARFFATAQDHKAVFDGDKGPNTGGMGAYSPAPIVDEEMQQRIMDEIIHPTMQALSEMDRPFTGVLFAGLMMTRTGPRLIEFNARFGDPETEVILPRLRTDLLALLYACAKGMLEGVEIKWYDRAALGVVMAARGYPGDYKKGTLIRGLEKAEAIPDATVYHAGTLRNAVGEVAANGGRVLCVTAVAAISVQPGEVDAIMVNATAVALAQAQQLAYQAVDQIDWPEGFCRRDIGWRVVAKNKAA